MKLSGYKNDAIYPVQILSYIEAFKNKCKVMLRKHIQRQSSINCYPIFLNSAFSQIFIKQYCFVIFLVINSLSYIYNLGGEMCEGN